ncbi:MAG: MBOAT family protein [Clostridia bacterium]|nr:MBOAT family protein [Clostridia bacterium]
MSFNSIEYLIFLPVTVLVCYLLPAKFRKYWLLAASYFFYMSWNPEMAVLIDGVTAVSYGGAFLTEWLREQKQKKKLSAFVAGVSVAVCVAVLAYFKYFGFLAETLQRIITLAGSGARIPVPEILLPVGISFFTFQALSYVIDVNRGKIKAERNFIIYALFVSFFPQLVAGPIERPDALIPQLKEAHKFTGENFKEGIVKILTGFFKKMAVADMIAGAVDVIYKSPEQAGGLGVIIGTALFAVQIYCDFSGYTDIATGSARLLGIKLSKNFDVPYSAVSVRDFWRRWHISLSGWFRDYVYIPLGGSRKGEARACLNYLIVFLLSGLWHGAAWHFAAWGLIHGLFIVFERLTEKFRDGLWRRLKVNPEYGLVTTLRRVATFVSVCFAWIFFRAGSIAEAFGCIKLIFTGWHAFTLENIGFTVPGLVSAVAGILVLAAIEKGRLDPEAERGVKAKRVSQVRNSAYVIVLWAVVAAWLLLMAGSGESAFIYFQF